MLKKTFLLVSFCLIFLFIFSNAAAETEEYPVYVVSVKGEIGPAWLLYLERSLAEAEAAGAQAIVLEIDTPGGFVDITLQAREYLMEFDGSLYAYVNTRALSAGAYLALVAEQFYMAPGATMGSAEPRLPGRGEVTDEKFLSYWEGEMRSVAEMRDRDPRLAAAMVRRDLEVEDLVEKGKLLTLTANDGEMLGFSDGTAESLEIMLDQVGLAAAPLVRTSPTPWEQLGGWLINPIVATAILTLAFLLLFVEILTAGFGLAGLLSFLCFGLYFGGHLFSGVSGWLAIFLFLFGVVLILVEAFMPGFGVFGIGGLVAVSASIVLSAVTAVEGLRILLYSFILSALCGYFAFRYFHRKGMLRRFVLQDAATREKGYSSSTDLQHLVGKQGVSITPLRPAGIADVEQARYDVISEGSYIQAGEKVVVTRVEGSRVIVKTQSHESENGNEPA